MHRNALAITLALALGLGTGAATAWWNTPDPVAAKLDPARFNVEDSNTPGFPEIKSGDFDLVDHKGRIRTSRNPDGLHQLVFFGYARCKAICSVALPNIAEATNLLAGMGIPVTPVLITVDPKRDTVAALARAVPDIHPEMIGLTGNERNLAAAYKAFNLEKKFLFDHAEEGAVYSHGSFIYLLSSDGEFRTLFAPIISPLRVAEITAGYIAEDQAQGGV